LKWAKQDQNLNQKNVLVLLHPTKILLEAPQDVELLPQEVRVVEVAVDEEAVAVKVEATVREEAVAEKDILPHHLQIVIEAREIIEEKEETEDAIIKKKIQTIQKDQEMHLYTL